MQMKNFFHKKKFGVTNHGLKLDFLPFIDFKTPSNLDLCLSNKNFFISDFIK